MFNSYDDEWSSCVCHGGVTWPVEELDTDGHCPMWHYENDLPDTDDDN